jgi:hypothetical protein
MRIGPIILAHVHVLQHGRLQRLDVTHVQLRPFEGLEDVVHGHLRKCAYCHELELVLVPVVDLIMPLTHFEKMDTVLLFLATYDVSMGEALTKSSTSTIRHAQEHLIIIANQAMHFYLLGTLYLSESDVLLTNTFLILVATDNTTWLRTWTKGLCPMQIVGA